MAFLVLTASGEGNWRRTSTTPTTTVIYDNKWRLKFMSGEVNRLLATTELGLDNSNGTNPC
jgi:hypothetical protein